MWLAKLFGGQRDDSEPSEFPPHPAANTGAAPSRPAATMTTPGGGNAVHKALPKAKVKGFDPYNSGVFRKAAAWERIGKR